MKLYILFDDQDWDGDRFWGVFTTPEKAWEFVKTIPHFDEPGHFNFKVEETNLDPKECTESP